MNSPVDIQVERTSKAKRQPRKRKFRYLRKEHVSHPRFDCALCQSKFDRPDAFSRHKQTQKHRKRSTHPSLSRRSSAEFIDRGKVAIPRIDIREGSSQREPVKDGTARPNTPHDAEILPFSAADYPMDSRVEVSAIASLHNADSLCSSQPENTSREALCSDEILIMGGGGTTRLLSDAEVLEISTWESAVDSRESPQSSSHPKGLDTSIWESAVDGRGAPQLPSDPKDLDISTWEFTVDSPGRDSTTAAFHTSQPSESTTWDRLSDVAENPVATLPQDLGKLFSDENMSKQSIFSKDAFEVATGLQNASLTTAPSCDNRQHPLLTRGLEPGQASNSADYRELTSEEFDRALFLSKILDHMKRRRTIL
ncbi:MAG: hypothetical protein M1817_000680 [Caeruleum heppii]|nr:MAG: hypothetical protein M1817_000680 [Caeruleum heppii]